MAWFAGMDKQRSKFGKFLDKIGIVQEVVSKKSGVPNSTVSGWCDGSKKIKPIRRTANKVLKAIEELTGKKAKYEDFWT